MDQLIVQKLSIALQESILKKEVDTSSTTNIIVKGMELMETFPNMKGDQKKSTLIKVVELVAAGKDGIIGTADDIIPAAAVESLKVLLEKDLLGSVIQTIADASKGKFNLNKTVAIVTEVKKSCFPGLKVLFEKFGKNRKGKQYKE
jgi:hypothetical protein